MKTASFSCRKLFLEMLKISAFTFGGGFVIIGMMKKKFADELHWISAEEVLDMTAIAQSAPGALAVNSAVIFGYRLAGVKGAAVATLATVLPPLVIISLITLVYNAFATNAIVHIVLQVMRAGVAAVIVDVVIDLAGGVIRSGRAVDILLMLAAFVASWFCRVSAIRIILLFLALGFARGLRERKKAQA